MYLNLISEWLSINLIIILVMSDSSDLDFFKNFLRTGILKNKSLIIIVVPSDAPVGVISPNLPASPYIVYALSLSFVLLIKVTFVTLAIELSASPRKPSVATCSRSSILFSLLVACGLNAFTKSSVSMPQPLSTILI